MKAVTEFPSFTLTKALNAKNSLTAEGKTPEEIQTSLGETFKMEGEKVKHLMNSADVAGQNSQNLRRVLVVSLNEGENPPAKAVKVEEHYYVPEFLVTSQPAAPTENKGSRHGGRGGKGKGGGGPKSSPWGMSPEELAAKKAGKGAKPAKA